MKQIYLTAEMILKYLQGDEELGTLIICKNDQLNLMTTDQSVYEALGSINDRRNFNFNKLVKFFEVVDVSSYREKFRKERQILTDLRVNELQSKL